MNKSLSDKVDISNLWLTVSSIILLSVSFTYIFSCFELILKIPLFKYNIVLAYLAANFIIYIYRGLSKLLLSNVIFVAFSSIFYYSISKTYDASWDGQWYHQDAILKLIEGWNPFYSTYDSSLSISESDMWIHHYPQASWMVQACILKFGNSIQATKILHLLLSLATFGIAFYVIRNILRINTIITALFSLCIAFNPITYSQFFSFYVDGQSATGLSMYLLVLVFLAYQPNKLFYILLACLFIYIANIKFTNLIYLSVFNIIYFIWMFINNPKAIRVKLFAYLSIIYCLGILILGYSSYTRNVLEKGNPFYPILGKNNVGNIVKDIPLSANFKDQNRFQNILDASFAYPVYARQPDSSKFRMPFTKVNYDNFFRTDAELSGFGARWSEILVISALLLCYLLIKLNPKKRLYLLLLLSTILLSVFINEQCFVARYVPQLWLLPMVLILFIFNENGILNKVLSVSFSLFLLYNTSKIIETQVNYQAEVRKNINLEIDFLKSLHRTIEVKCKYKSVLARLNENNISYIVIDNDNTKEHHQFNYTAEENYYIIP